MRTRGRVAGMVAAVATLLIVPAAGPSAEAASGASFTRVRITVTSSSDWTTVKLLGVGVRDQAIDSVASGGDVELGGGGFTFHEPTATPGSVAVVDAVLEVAPNAKPVLQVDKGNLGSVQVSIVRTNTTDAPVISMDTGPGPLKTATVDRPIDRATLVGESLTLPRADPRRLVLAFYYPWFRSGSFDTGLWYDRPSGPYATDDAASVDAMVSQAQAAGIDGFIVSWDGSTTSADRFDLLFQVAANHPGFVIVPYLELVSLQQSGHTSVSAIDTAAEAALSRSTQAPYLKVGGRPALFVYGSWTLQPSQWQSTLTSLTAAGYQPFVVGDGSNPAFGFDGFHLYNPNQMDDASLRNFDWTSMRRLRIPHVLHPDTPQGLWAATVSPGENRIGRSGVGAYRSRDGGLRYDQTWSDALSSKPDWVLITSWNEWFETTEIQPAQQAGSRALDQTKGWTTQFHNSS